MKKSVCWECTGDGWMIGGRPCKVCRGTGYLMEEEAGDKNNLKNNCVEIKNPIPLLKENPETPG